MIFDSRCHFSMQIQKAYCADETEVVTSPHNDCAFIEWACQTHARGALRGRLYSMGDNVPLAELALLQQRSGLFLFIDDSHPFPSPVHVDDAAWRALILNNSTIGPSSSHRWQRPLAPPAGSSCSPAADSER